MNKNVFALIDCDSFFASCEQAVNEELKDKPVCVMSNNMGCVIARSKQAKILGVEMCMPYVSAKKRFPDVVYLRGNIELYKSFSKKIMLILREYSPNVEVYSIDEAFVDLTGTRKLYGMNYFKIAKSIRERIKKDVGVDVSIGLSVNKTLAKLASYKAKKMLSGIYIVGKSKINKELQATQVGEVWGIGHNSKTKLKNYAIFKASDYTRRSEDWIKEKFGKKGVETYLELKGEMVSKVVSDYRQPKSIQYTRTFMEFTDDKNFIKGELNTHIHKACLKLRKEDGKCRHVGVMLRTKDFHVEVLKGLLSEPCSFELDISRLAFELFEKIYSKGIIYRSAGVFLDGLVYGYTKQLGLFDDVFAVQKDANLSKAVKMLQKKFGDDAIQLGLTHKD